MIALEISASSSNDRRFEDLDEGIRDAVGAAIIRGLDAVVADARANVAALRDPGRPDPSLLAASIHADRIQDSLSGVVRAGGDIAPYAVFVEFGTVRAPAQPFLGPAFAANADRIRNDMASALNGALGDHP